MKQRLQDLLLDWNPDRKKLLFILGGVVLFILLLVIVLSTVSGGSARKYDKFYKEAEAAYLSHDYVTAEEKLRQAMDVKSTEQAYLLMADIYTAQGETDRAIQLLYLGYSRIGGDKIATRLDQLKSENGGASVTPSQQGSVTVAGVTVDGGASSLVLSGKGLSSADRNAISTLKNMESLSISDCGISDLGFLSGLDRLTLLQVSDNAVRDLKPLAALGNLKTLYIDNNPIGDLSALYGLSNLRTLSMKGIDVTEEQLDALKKALPNCKVYADKSEDEGPKEITLGGRTFSTDVTELNLGGLALKDISALSACKDLVKLDLRDNKISDISPLVDLQNLQWLCIWNNEVEDIYPLLSLRALKYLDADGNKISDISVLESMDQLEELWLNNNPVKSKEPLRGLTHLIRLVLLGTGLDDEGLDCLMGMKNLLELNIKRNKDITAKKVAELQAAIPNCVISHDELRSSILLGNQEFEPDVKVISLPSRGIDDLSMLTDCSALEELRLYGNAVSDLTPLGALTTLKVLDLQNNKITDISPLSGCKHLRTLLLSENRLTSVAPLAACAELTELDLDRTGILDIAPLAALSRLQTLHLEGNRISDLSALYGLSQLETLYVRGNGLTADDIMALQTQLPKCTVIHDVTLTEEDLSHTPGLTPPTRPSSGSDLR